MDTKLRGDIAEQAAVLHALKQGWGVLRPVGDRLPYDLVFSEQCDSHLFSLRIRRISRLLQSR